MSGLSIDNFANYGLIVLQGPHQSVQKSMTHLGLLSMMQIKVSKSSMGTTFVFSDDDGYCID